MKSAQSRHRFMSIQSGIQKRRSNPACLQCIDLVFHQRNERRDYNRQTLAHQSWQLKTKRLSAAGWHQREHIAPGKRIVNNRFLERTKIRIPEVLFERAPEIQTHLTGSFIT